MAIVFSRRPGLVAYITCGDPDLATSREVVLAAARAGADVIELGVPFSDPVADGPVIQRASERALRAGTTLAGVLELARQVRRQTEVGLVIFSYLNPVLRFGMERFAAAALAAGVDGALITDLSVDEAGDYLAVMRARDLATVFLAAPTSTEHRLKRIAQATTGFIYAVSRTGVTGARDEFPPEAQQLVARLRRHTRLPVAVGFGIATAQQVAAAAGFADAVVVGSAIMQTVEQSPPGQAPRAAADLIAGLLPKAGKAAD